MPHPRSQQRCYALIRLGGLGPLLALAIPFFWTGCASHPGILSLIKEQRTLDVRKPEMIFQEPLKVNGPPLTVSSPGDKTIDKHLALDEAIRIALGNSQVVHILTGTGAVPSGHTIYDPAIANTQIDAAKGVFDPVFTTKHTVGRAETPLAIFDPANPLGASIPPNQVTNYALGLSLSKKWTGGGTLSVAADVSASRFRPDFLNPLNPEEQSGVALSWTQPLLQGAGSRANLAPITIARIKTELSYFQLKDSVQELVRGVAEAYWHVYSARTEAWVRREQVKQTRGAYERAEARMKAKLGTAAEMAQAKTALYNFLAASVTADANLLNREATLRNIMSLSPTDPERLVPTTPPFKDRNEANEPTWEETVTRAQKLRPDLIELSLILEADEQNLLIARNQALPKADATMMYRWNGLEGMTPVGARLSTGPGQFKDWSAGVNFSVPLGLRAPRANLRSAELILMVDRATLSQSRLNALHALAGNHRELARSHEQYNAFREASSAALENVRAQLAEFEVGGVAGRPVIFLNLLQAITDWGNTISSEAQALGQYNVELANVHRQIGDILELHGIAFVEERFGSIGPLGRLARDRDYPSALVLGANEDRYRKGETPPEMEWQKKLPSMKPLTPPVKEAPPIKQVQQSPVRAEVPPARFGTPVEVRSDATSRRREDGLAEDSRSSPR